MGMWVRFWLLAGIWGSSFLFMKLATTQFDAISVTMLRLVGAAGVFAGFLWLTRRSPPREFKAVAALLVVGVFNTAVPFSLITWGNASIDTGLTTILISAAPFFALTIAHVFLRDERLNRGKLLGLGLGFVGVVILVQRAAAHGDTGTVPTTVAGAGAETAEPSAAVVGALAVIGGTLCYGICLTLIRLYLRQVEPIRVAGYSVMAGGAAMLPIWLVLGQPWPAVGQWQPWPVAALGLLALVHTVVAYFLFYRLMGEWGPRASFVTYAMPPIGVALGALVLGEQAGWPLFVGGALVLAGIWVAQAAHRRQSAAQAAAPQPAGELAGAASQQERA